jgi:hypothetical protein
MNNYVIPLRFHITILCEDRIKGEQILVCQAVLEPANPISKLVHDCVLLSVTTGRAIAQAVSGRLPTATARVQTGVWSCGIL